MPKSLPPLSNGKLPVNLAYALQVQTGNISFNRSLAPKSSIKMSVIEEKQVESMLPAAIDLHKFKATNTLTLPHNLSGDSFSRASSKAHESSHPSPKVLVDTNKEVRIRTLSRASSKQRRRIIDCSLEPDLRERSNLSPLANPMPKNYSSNEQFNSQRSLRKDIVILSPTNRGVLETSDLTRSIAIAFNPENIKRET